jgi:hypothetical protein
MRIVNIPARRLPQKMTRYRAVMRPDSFSEPTLPSPRLERPPAGSPDSAMAVPTEAALRWRSQFAPQPTRSFFGFHRIG